MNKEKSLLLKIFFVGIIIRLIFAPFTGHPWDMAVWFQRAEFIFNFGINPLYLWLFGSILLPIMFLPHLIYLFYTSILQLPQNILLLNIITKLPFILADLLIGLFIYKISYLLSNDSKKSILISSIWIFNPLVIFVSSIHGMFDTIPSFFLLLSFYFIIIRKHIFSSLFLFLGIATKYFPIFLLPLFFVYIWDKTKIKTKIKIFILGIIITLISFGPFLLNTAIFKSFIRGLLFHSVGYQTGVKPYSIFKIFFDLGIINILPKFIINNLFWIIYIPIFIFLMIHAVKNRKYLDSKRLLIYSSIILLLLLPFNLNSLPQFIIWSLPLLLITGYLFYNKIKVIINLLWLFAILTILTNTNLFIYFLNINPLITRLFNWYLYNPTIATILGLIYNIIIIIICILLFRKFLYKSKPIDFDYNPTPYKMNLIKILKFHQIIIILTFIFILFIFSHNIINSTYINKPYFNQDRIYKSTFSYHANNSDIVNLDNQIKRYDYNFFVEPYYFFSENTWKYFKVYFCVDTLPTSLQQDKTVLISLNNKPLHTYKLNQKIANNKFTTKNPFYLVLPPQNNKYWCSIIENPENIIKDESIITISIEDGIKWKINDAKLQLDLKEK